MAQQALGVTGAVIGGYFGGPAGAQLGFALGSALGAALDPPEVQGQRLGEAPVQTGRTGVPIPVGWNVIHVHGNKININPHEDFIEKEKQGKGGGATVENERRKQTFAIGICVGPAISIRRIWENDKLVYDRTENPTIDAEESDEYEKNFRFYTGSNYQLPDPDLEAHWGSRTPYYRGLAYVVYPDYDITDFGSAIPQLAFEVLMFGGGTFSSRPYPVDVEDALDTTLPHTDGNFIQAVTEGFALTVTPADHTLRDLLLIYGYDEAVDITVSPTNQTLRDLFNDYTFTEAVDVTVAPQDGTLRVVLIDYDIPDDAVDVTVTPQDGTLT